MPSAVITGKVSIMIVNPFSALSDPKRLRKTASSNLFIGRFGLKKEMGASRLPNPVLTLLPVSK